MPPCVTAYVLTDRTETVLRRFVDLYVDVEAADEKLKDADLTLAPKDPSSADDVEAWGWEAAKNLWHALSRGLEEPSLAFALYLPPSRSECHATIAFTYDGKLVLGLEVDDPLNEPGPLQEAKRLLAELVGRFETAGSFVCCEEAPPLTHAEFAMAAARNDY